MSSNILLGAGMFVVLGYTIYALSLIILFITRTIRKTEIYEWYINNHKLNNIVDTVLWGIAVIIMFLVFIMAAYQMGDFVQACIDQWRLING